MLESARSEKDIAVLTVDDQPAFRAVMREVVEATPGFTAVGEASSGKEALELVATAEPQMIVIDVRMPYMDGIETARRLKEAHPDFLIVLVSCDEDGLSRAKVEGCGAATYLRKQDLKPATLRALWTRHGQRLPGAA